MRNKFFIIGVLLVTTFLFNTGIVNAKDTFYESADGEEWTLLSATVGEDVLVEGGETVYCLNPYMKVTSGYSSQDAVDYFASRDTDEDKTEEQKRADAQELVTKIALYQQYAYKAGGYFSAQAAVWRALASFEGWNKYFTCNSCKRDIINGDNGVDEDYKNNKSKYKGIGHVYYNDDGQPMGWFEAKKIYDDYYLDVACTNCGSNNFTGAYRYQDILNWEAILNSEDSENDNVKKYYKKTTNDGCDIYCREEYIVTFPNKKDFNSEQFNISSGRYFTINEVAPLVANGIANFGPIRVEKVRQCRSKQEGTSCMDSFAENVGIGEMGTIELSYKESSGKYHIENIELAPSKTIKETGPYYEDEGVANTDTLTMKKTVEYTVKTGSSIWKAIKRGTGEPLKGLNDDKDFYLVSSGAFIPISFNTDGKNVTGEITLNYNLPTNDDNSRMYKAVKDKNYFGKDMKNPYKQYENGEIDSSQPAIKNSSCAMLYDNDLESEGFKNCLATHVESALGNCTDNNSAGNKDGKNYICTANVCGQNKSVCPDGSCPNPDSGLCDDDDDGDDGDGECNAVNHWTRYNRDWNPVKGDCCPQGTKYTGDGKCGDDDKYICKKIDTSKYYGKDGRLITSTTDFEKECCFHEGDTYKIGDEVVSKQKYLEICPPDGDDCPYDCKYGCCPTREWTHMICRNEDGTCPYDGPNNDIIYRPIDLNDPFPGQSGSSSKNRDTGANWCTYSLTNGTINCAGGNSSSKGSGNGTVKAEIKNNRGVSGYEVYTNKNPLYEIELDAKTIKNIRKYNDRNVYDKWNLICTSAGVCHSEFLDDIKISGTCSRNSDLASCAER